MDTRRNEVVPVRTSYKFSDAEMRSVPDAFLDPPDPFGNISFKDKILSDIKGTLTRQASQLDGNQARGLLQVDGGKTLVFKENRIVDSKADFRISKTVGYPYVEWDAPDELKEEVVAICQELIAFWRDGGKQITQSEDALKHLFSNYL